MAEEELPEYRIEEVTFNDEPHVEMAVLTNGIRFHIDFRQKDLREPGQSCPGSDNLPL